jgi:iron complex outermembrane receptor protein
MRELGCWFRKTRLVTGPRVRAVRGGLIATIILSVSAAPPFAPSLAAQDLKRLSLEELLRIEVSTTLRVPEPASAVPAALFVMTADDIRRSGATSLPELLRSVPGVHVAQIDAGRYAIGIRGFADRLARSMLVLIDGRAVYSPLFAGTYWEVQDTFIEDIERIEVVRGPGGTLWGANAVNGIINIVTKRARDTRGMLVTAALGPGTRGPVGVRYGRQLGRDAFLRAYVKGVDRQPQVHLDGADYDESRMTQSGLRGEWTFDGSRVLTVQGDLYRSELGQRVTRPLLTPPFSETTDRLAKLSGGNALARWSAPFGGGEYQLHTYFDRTTRDERPVAETRETFDLDLQHRRRIGSRHGVVWGAGYRVTRGDIAAVETTSFFPPQRTDHLYTAFVQDDVSLRPERLRLVVGLKLEHNAYTGLEGQPSARVMWTPSTAQALFVAVTRAVRTPSRVETDYATTSVADPSIPAFVRLVPNPDFVAEKLTAYEVGYRLERSPLFLLSATTFFNHLQDTESTELLTPFVETTPLPARLILPVTFRNGLHGNSHGIELTGDLRPVPRWRSTISYALVRIQMTRDPGSNDVSQERRNERLSPRHQVEVQTSLDVLRNISADWFLRYVSELREGPVPAYATSTVRIGWQLHRRMELALVGQNLHQSRHREWPGAHIQIRRTAHISFVWRP